MKIICQDEAIISLRNGKPLIFQTDTLPAIGCRPEYAEKIYEIKRRSKSKALILMGSKIDQVVNFVNHSARDDFKKIAENYWPGPLTLVVPLSENCHIDFFSSDRTIGIRIPNSLSAQSLISKTGPLATSSANISGLSTSFTAEEVSMDLPKIDILGPIPWEKCSRKGSTIISWQPNGDWKLIRNGQISIHKIKS